MSTTPPPRSTLRLPSRRSCARPRELEARQAEAQAAQLTAIQAQSAPPKWPKVRSPHSPESVRAQGHREQVRRTEARYAELLKSAEKHILGAYTDPRPSKWNADNDGEDPASPRSINGSRALDFSAEPE